MRAFDVNVAHELLKVKVPVFVRLRRASGDPGTDITFV